MSNSRRVPLTLLGSCIVALFATSSLAMISVGTLTKDRAKEKYGIATSSHEWRCVALQLGGSDLPLATSHRTRHGPGVSR
jgi:hypothetical protein